MAPLFTKHAALLRTHQECMHVVQHELPNKLVALTDSENNAEDFFFTNLLKYHDNSCNQLLFCPEFSSLSWRIRCSSAFSVKKKIRCRKNCMVFLNFLLNFSDRNSRWTLNSSRIWSEFWPEKQIEWSNVEKENLSIKLFNNLFTWSWYHKEMAVEFLCKF